MTQKEKQLITSFGDRYVTIDIDKMVFEYSTTEDGDLGFPINCMIRAYRKGIEDVLELQKGFAPIEPKFKVGDWVVDDKTPNDVFCVIEVLEEIYKVIDIDGDDYHIPHCKADNQFHLWTIADAKDGDVLASKDEIEILIFRNLDTSTSFSSYYNITGRGDFGWSNICFIPATKEQCNLLFEKMKEKGYKWDNEKKELNKIEQNAVSNIEPKFHPGDWVIDNVGYISNRKCD